MTVIDYLPVGEEIRPNVLLSQTKKCIISKVMACITVFLLAVYLDKQQNNCTRIPPPEYGGLACINKGIICVFAWRCFRDGPLRAGVPVCRAAHASGGTCLLDALLSPWQLAQHLV